LKPTTTTGFVIIDVGLSFLLKLKIMLYRLGGQMYTLRYVIHGVTHLVKSSSISGLKSVVLCDIFDSVEEYSISVDNGVFSEVVEGVKFPCRRR